VKSHETPAPIRISLKDLGRAVAERGRQGRIVVAVAGAPGSGKSTLAERLETVLNEGERGAAAILPMDGYHYDDRILVERGLRPRKGAPETFDVGGLLHTLGRLRSNEEAEVAVPVFDRDLEISRGSARIIPQTVRYLIVEGLYLLLDRAPWSSLGHLFDMTVMIDVPEDVLRQRLIARWRGYGLSPDAITAKLDDNDLPNGRFILANNRPAQFVLSPEPDA
jgi:pantothenate kinase